jgi:hypothetical protein
MAKKPTVTTLQSGFNSTETLNANFEALRDGFDNTLSLDGSTPNAMEADLDLNGNNIIGAAGLLINGTDYLSDVEAAKAAALVAQAAAELAETNAETAETNAESSETAAGLSATASATSATASAASAVDATNNGATQVALAAAQVTLAETAKTAAELAETNAETAESNAATSATNAATSATTASTGASTASTKASEAAISATNSATSATESETAKTAAEAAKDAALAALDSFDDRYLGAKASDPTLDNDGNALVAGALYYNTTDDVMKVYEGSSWVAAYASLSGALLATNNLSDLVNATSARTNLGLGTAATTASTDYATAAQGTLADAAVQPNDSPTFNSIIATGAAASYTDTGLYLQNKGSSIFDVGAWRSGASVAELTFSTDSGSDAAPVEAMRIDSAGRVGIGTTNPSTNLDVVGGIRSTSSGGYNQITTTSIGDAVFNNNGNNWLTVKDGVPANAMRIDSGGNVGIGTSSPSSNLEVIVGDTNAVSIKSDGHVQLYDNTSSSRAYTFLSRDISNAMVGGNMRLDASVTTGSHVGYSSGTDARGGSGIVFDNTANGSLEYGDITFVQSNDTNDDTWVVREAMRIDTTGNVGIGTTSPSSLLHVNSGGTNNVATFESTDGTASVKFVDGNQTLNVTIGAKGNDFYVQAGGNEKFRIEESGNVGIGKTNPATALDVSGTVTATSFAGDGSSLTGIAAGAGGGGNDEIFWENGQNVTTNYTITNGKNAMSAGPITINSGVTVTVGAGETWTVI